MKTFTAITLFFLFSITANGQKFAVQFLPPLAFNYDARYYTQDDLGTSVIGGDIYILFLRKITLQTTFFKNFKDVISTSAKPNIIHNPVGDSLSYPYKPFVNNELELTWNFFSSRINKKAFGKYAGKSDDHDTRSKDDLWKAAGLRGGFIQNRRVMPVYTPQWVKNYGGHGWSAIGGGYDTMQYDRGTTNLSTSSFTAGVSVKTAYRKDKVLYGLMSRTKSYNTIHNNYAATGSVKRNILWELYFDVLHTTGLNYDDFMYRGRTVNIDPATFDKWGWRVGAQRIVMNAFGSGIKIEFGNMPGQKKFPGIVEGSHSFGKNMYLQIGFTLSAGAI